MSQPHWKVHILLVLLASYPTKSVGTTSIPQCIENVISCAENSSSLTCTSSLNISSTTAISVLRTSNGSFIPPELSSIQGATALSYAGCLEFCGSGSQEPFNWGDFSQEYSTWLLPYLALLSQLPFGARRRTDDLMSAILTLGSPTLAGYSLYLTLLNARWVNDHAFGDIHYPSAVVRRSVVRVLANLQQVPLRVHPGEDARFESLVIHPDNDDWWIVFAEELEYSQTWSIASITSILWVVVAYILSVANALSNLANYRNGEGTASGLLWLLPVVVGWLILSPKCNYKRVLDAYNKANKRAFVADATGNVTHEVTSNFGMTISPSLAWQPRTNIISPDESRIPPIFNYARVWLWAENVYVTSLFYRTASERSNCRIGVDGQQIPGSVCNDVPRESRLGKRSQIIQYCDPGGHEYRGTSVIWPRGIFFNMAVASLMGLQLQWGTTGAALLGSWFTPTIGLGCRSLVYLLYGLLSTSVWILLVLSSILGYYAHYLLNSPSAFNTKSAGKLPLSSRPQSSITPSLADGDPSNDAAILMHEFPTPSGEASNHNLDGPASAAAVREGQEEESPQRQVEMETLRESNHDMQRLLPPEVLYDQGTCHCHATTSPDTALAQIPHPSIKHTHALRTTARTLRQLSNLLRWIGKTIAVLNAILSIANALFEYAGVYETCFCDASVFTWGSDAFVVFAPSASDYALLEQAWHIGLALALSCCTVFVGSIFLVRDSLPS